MEENYEIQEETTDSKKKEQLWGIGIGLQAVDDLKVSDELIEASVANVNNEITNQEVEERIYQYYETMKENNTEPKNQEVIKRQKEADLVATRIVSMLSSGGFTLSPIMLKEIHKKLFDGIYDFAGEFRTCNLTKKEPILHNKSVVYADYGSLEEYLDYDIQTEKKAKIKKEDLPKHLAKFTSDIWQVHPFREGNTRTVAVFIEKYLMSLGYDITNDMFKDNSKYFRNSLVRANYTDITNGIYPEMKYLEMFYKNLLEGKKHILSNKDLFLRENFKEQDYEK